jgi:hypothetical protein
MVFLIKGRWMKKITLVFIALFFLCSAVYSQDDGNAALLFKKGLDGTFWQSMDEVSKFAFLMGISQGITYDAIINNRDDMAYVKKYLDGILPVIHPLTVMDYFDKFYSNEENIKIPIVGVWDFFILEHQGAITDEEMQEMILQFRKGFN